MSCDIDDSRAGGHAEALTNGAERFCEEHKNEDWEILGLIVQTGLSLTAWHGDREFNAVLAPVMPEMMEHAVFEKLESFRNSI